MSVMTEAEMARADEADMVREIAYSDALRRLTDPCANPPEVICDLRSAYHRAARIERGQPPHPDVARLTPRETWS